MPFVPWHLKFAYNEASFMLIRLLQQFSTFELAQHEANPAKVPVPGWAESRLSNGKDRVRIRSHLTMFVDVSGLHMASSSRVLSVMPSSGRFVGEDGRSTAWRELGN